MKIIIDTNILYDYYGRDNKINGSKNNYKIRELKQILESNSSEIFVSAFTVLEAITHFHKDYANAQNLLKFIIKNGIRIINHNNILLQNEYVLALATMPKVEFNSCVLELITKKIDIEAKWGIIICSLMLSVYLDFYFEKEEKTNEKFRSLDFKEKDKLKSLIHKTILNEIVMNNFDADLNWAASEITSGYFNENNTSANKKAKLTYNDFLMKYLVILSVFAENMINNYLDSCFYRDLDEALKASSEAQKLIQNRDHVTKIVTKSLSDFKDKHGIDYINENKDLFCQIWMKRETINYNQANYLYNLITSWMNKNAKLEKNDIFDFLIFGSLDDGVLLTRDKKMVEFLKKINHESIKYIKKIVLED